MQNNDYEDPLMTRTGRQILIVDGDRSSREHVRTALTRVGHIVEAAGDVWQAWVRVRARSFDIGLIALDLPAVGGVDVGGWDVVRIARAYWPAMAVIVLSAAEDATPGPNAVSLDVTGIMAKPINLRELTDLIGTLPLRDGARGVPDVATREARPV
jgi:DNA-binding response OmpR family regulator